MSEGIDRLREVVHRMVWPGGCAWHEAQTHETLTKFLVEESAELIDAIDRDLGPEEVSGELGDVLYQVMFHAAIAERDGEGYDLDAVADALADKLVARHPHVFGDRGYMSVEELNDEWERLKEDAAGVDRGSRDVFEGIPASMPTLAKAAKIVDRIARAERSCDFAQDDADGGSPPDILRAESAANEVAGSAPTETEVGEALLDTVRRANAAGIDSDRALRLALGRLME